MSTPKLEKLPDVLIQKPQGHEYFLIPANELEKYRLTADVLSRIDPTTVTFVIPDPDMLDAVPPFLSQPTENPSVLIQHYRGKASYFLTSEDLKKYKVNITPEEKAKKAENRIAFVMPVGIDAIEKLPEIMQSFLQSNELTGGVIRR